MGFAFDQIDDSLWTRRLNAGGHKRMIPIQQTKRGGSDLPPEERGDCWAACVASILEVPLADVYVSHDTDTWWADCQRVLARHGYCALPLCLKPDDKWLTDNPGVHWIAQVPSLNLGADANGDPFMHVIVMRGLYVAHDPSLDDVYETSTPLALIPCAQGIVLVKI